MPLDRRRLRELLLDMRRDFAASHPEIHRDPVLWMAVQRWLLMLIDIAIDQMDVIEQLEQTIRNIQHNKPTRHWWRRE